MDRRTNRGEVESSPRWDEQDLLLNIDESIQIGEFDMATRGCIARKAANGIEARYHHWDSYPSALGAALFHLYHDHFQCDVEAMLAVLIDQHPAGWSTINDKDFSLAPGFSTFEFNAGVGRSFNSQLYYQQLAVYEKTEQARRPQCYCHGERHEEGHLYTSLPEAHQSGAAYAYVIDSSTLCMEVYALRPNERLIAQVDLNGDEPNWDEME
jgi:hypothetical protein